jgi:hypothetical protein
LWYYRKCALSIWKIDTLPSLFFGFWGCLISVQKSDFSMQSERWTENGKHLQKTMKTLAECDGAAAQVCVSFFYLLIGMFLIAFMNSWCQKMSWQSQSQFAVELCFVTEWHRLLWKQLLLCVVANKKWYLYWLFWFCGCQKVLMNWELLIMKVVVLKL